MNVTKTKSLALWPVDKSGQQHLGYEGRQILELGKQHGWDFAHLGHAQMPEERVNLPGWIIVPAEEDVSPVPPRSLERIQEIYSSGLRPKGFVVVHEAPALLPASVNASGGSIRVSTIDPRIKRSARTVIGATGAAAVGLAVLPSLLALAMAAVMGLAALLLPLALLAGLALDPILVAVTEDGAWIEIDRWWTEE